MAKCPRSILQQTRFQYHGISEPIPVQDLASSFYLYRSESHEYSLYEQITLRCLTCFHFLTLVQKTWVLSPGFKWKWLMSIQNGCNGPNRIALYQLVSKSVLPRVLPPFFFVPLISVWPFFFLFLFFRWIYTKIGKYNVVLENVIFW